MTGIKEQKVFLAAVGRNASAKALEESLEELSRLAVSAGFRPAKRFRQSLKTFDPAFLIGSGKLKEISLWMEKEAAPPFVIVDHALTGAQSRNLAKFLNTFVLDRSQLILEIFARRAKSFEGKLQVQLARLLDEMSRMTGAWLGSLSRQGGGAGGARRGPGEKAIETDRRRAQANVKKIRQRLKKVRLSRREKRSSRKKRQIPSFALVGYTNSGKSSLLNRLSKTPSRIEKEAKDQLFMTLDPKTRKLFLPQIKEAVATDTVGFIRRLPHHLIEAFKATLEESSSADVLLHVIDASSPRRNMEIEVVERLFKEFQWSQKPVIYVFNKADIARFKPPPEKHRLQVLVSAKTGFGLANLRRVMQESLKRLKRKTFLFFPKGSESFQDQFNTEIQTERMEEDLQGAFCEAFLTDREIKKWKPYIIEERGKAC